MKFAVVLSVDESLLLILLRFSITVKFDQLRVPLGTSELLNTACGSYFRVWKPP